MGANKKISELTAGSAIGGTEELPIVQSGSTVKTTISAIKTYFDTIYATISGYVKKGTLTTNYIPKATASDTIGNSQVFDNGTNVGIGTATPNAKLSFGNYFYSGTPTGSDISSHIKLYESGSDYFGLGVSSGGMFNLYAGVNGRYNLYTNNGDLKNIIDNDGAYYNYTKYVSRQATYRDDCFQIQDNNSLVYGNIGFSNDGFIFQSYNAKPLILNQLGNDVKLTHSSSKLNIENLTASQIVETDSSKNLVSAAKGTAYNKDFGTGTTNVVEIGSTLGNTKPIITSSSGKLQTSDWVDIVSSCTFVGWSSYTTQVVDVLDMGNYYMLSLLVSGTSNSTTTTIQLPYTSLSQNSGTGLFTNNGTSIFGRYVLLNGGDTITFTTTATGSAWTASGTKGVGINIFFKK